MKSATWVLVLTVLTWAGPANSQEAKDPWIGKRGITHYGAVLKVGDMVVDDEGRANNLTVYGQARRNLRVYRVQYAKGEWLWLKAENSGVAGWMQSQYDLHYDQAIDYYTGLIRSTPKAAYFSSRGTLWKLKGEIDIAIADFSEAIRLEPSEAIYWNGRGKAWRDKKVYDKAITDFSEAIRLDSKDASCHKARGDAWASKKEFDQAIADYNEAIRLNPQDAGGFGARAWLWATCPNENCRDGKKAVESGTRACELTGWKDAYQLGNLAAAYAEAGDFEKAVEYQEKAHKLYSDEVSKKWGKLLDHYKNKKPYRDEG